MIKARLFSRIWGILWSFSQLACLVSGGFAAGACSKGSSANASQNANPNANQEASPSPTSSHALTQSPSSAAETPFQLTATIQELMDAELDPAADVLWEAVATVSRTTGVEERRPQTDDEWKEVRRAAIVLLEATNLLSMRGRRVSSQFIPASSDGSDLDSNAMQAKIDANRPLFEAFARGVHAAGTQLLAAVDAKDPVKLFDLGSDLDRACENCHTTFWYPNLQQ